MAISHQGVYVQTPIITPKSWTNADSANAKKTICTGGANGTKVLAITVTSTDSSARILQLWLTRSAVSYLLASLSIPITAGSDGSTAVANPMNSTIWPGLPVDNDGQPYFHLSGNGDTLQVSFTTQVTSAKEIDVACVSADF